jgi:uncharacterized protein YegP (UPF0339 family)
MRPIYVRSIPNRTSSWRLRAGPKRMTHPNRSVAFSSRCWPTWESKVSTLETRSDLSSRLLNFAWQEWGQLGASLSSTGDSPWAQDPEALAIFTFEIARDDPRLFDEVLDWMLANEPLVSVRRLRRLCKDDDDERLVEGAIGCLHNNGWRTAPRTPTDAQFVAEPLFRSMSAPTGAVDDGFAAWGLLRPVFRPSGKSRSPDVLRPINLAFRLRQLLGVGVRAEVLRVLLTIESPSVSAGVLSRAAGFSQRNVHETLAAWQEAGIVATWTVGSVQRYATNRSGWSALLEVGDDEFPWHRDWPQLFGALREILRFLDRLGRERLSDYMLDSLSRDLLEMVEPDLAYAGVRTARHGDRPWEDVRLTLEQTLNAIQATAAEDLVQPREWQHPRSSDEGRSGYVWRIYWGNGQPVAGSVDTFSTRASAARAAQNFRTRLDALEFNVSSDPRGGWRWNARASNGRTVAASPETFPTRDAARRAAARLRAGDEDSGEVEISER